MTKAVVKRGRPPKAVELAGKRSLPERITRMTQYHKAAQARASEAVLYAILCGMELIAARQDVAEGDWGLWVETNCPFEIATAYRYEEAAKRKTRDIPKLKTLCGFSDGLPPHLLSNEQHEQLVLAIKDETAGETLSSILGRSERTYDHIGGNAKLREWLSQKYPESRVKAVEDLTAKQRAEWEEHETGQRAVLAERKNALDRADWNKALSTVMTMIERRKFMAILTRGEIEHGAALLQDMRAKLIGELKERANT